MRLRQTTPKPLSCSLFPSPRSIRYLSLSPTCPSDDWSLTSIFSTCVCVLCLAVALESVNSGRPCHSKKGSEYRRCTTNTHSHSLSLSLTFSSYPTCFSWTVVQLCAKKKKKGFWGESRAVPVAPHPRGRSHWMVTGWRGRAGGSRPGSFGWRSERGGGGGWKHSSLTVFYWVFNSFLFPSLLFSAFYQFSVLLF